MAYQCSVTAIGYGGSACNDLKTHLQGGSNEKFTEVLSKFILDQFNELTSPFPLVGNMGQKLTMGTASPSPSENFSPNLAQNSGRGGPEGGRQA